MEEVFIQNETFDKVNLLAPGEYDGCTFINCDFTTASLAGISFADCTFTTCNLSLVSLIKTAFRTVMFKDCKMLGMVFHDCNPYGLSIQFDGCILDHSSYYLMKIKNTIFKNCRLHQADFTGCDLTAAVFDLCDLAGSTFDNTTLEKADLGTAYNYAINPALNKIKKAKFSLSQVTGLLHQYDIEIDQTA